MPAEPGFAGREPKNASATAQQEEGGSRGKHGFPRVTERAGFEPATDLSARTRFPVALLRPLGHLSRKYAGYRASLDRVTDPSDEGREKGRSRRPFYSVCAASSACSGSS